MRQALQRYWALILVCVVGLSAAAWVAAKAQPESYRGSAKILLLPTLGNPLGLETGDSGQQVTIAMETEATLVDSAAVAAISNAKLTPDWQAGTGVVKAAVPPNTQIVEISFTASTAIAAQAGAQSVATSYLTYRQQRSDATEESRSKELRAQFASVSKRLEEVTAEVDQERAAAEASGVPPTSSRASRQQQLLTDQYSSLSEQLSQLRAGDNNPGSVLSPAQLPRQAEGLDWRLVTGVGGLLGLALGLVLAITLTRADKRVRRSDVVAGDVPVLAVLGGGRRWWQRSVDPTGRLLRAAHQRLRTGILAAVPPSSTVAVTLAEGRGAVGDVVQELAGSFRRAGYRVVVVIADAEGDAAGLFTVEAGAGLSDVLTSQQPAQPLLVDRDGVWVLPPGADLEDRHELLSGDRFATMLRELASACDYVLVVAPVATSPAGMAVARLATGTVLVGQEMSTTSVDVEDVLDRAELVGARIIGLALRPRGHSQATRPRPPVSRIDVLAAGEARDALGRAPSGVAATDRPAGVGRVATPGRAVVDPAAPGRAAADPATPGRAAAGRAAIDRAAGGVGRGGEGRGGEGRGGEGRGGSDVGGTAPDATPVTRPIRTRGDATDGGSDAGPPADPTTGLSRRAGSIFRSRSG
ncbi:MAG: hypothetical protein ACRC35_06820 [Angustibacter sp.]